MTTSVLPLIAHLENKGRAHLARDADEKYTRCLFDLGEYFLGQESDGPWLRSRAFLAAGLRGDDVFLLLDPARLRAEPRQ